jgi:cytochrome c oxidase subunit II
VLVRRRLRRGLAWVALPPLLAACNFLGPQSALDPQGPIAQAQYDLFMWTYYLSWPVMIAVVGVIVYSIVRFRSKGKDDAALPHQTHGHTTLEIAWTLIPVVLVILVAVPTVRTIFATEYTIDPATYTDDDVVIRATGYQWWFEFDYGDGIVTSSEMHIPIGRRVIVELDSADVLHAFWVPNLAGKRDMIPNQANTVFFQADRPGVYFGQCAEYCLGAHAYMRFRVIASEEEGYQAWLASFRDAATAPRTVQADPLVERGRQLMAQKGCIGCHTVDGYAAVPVGTPEFPNLTNFGLRRTVGASILDATPENVAAWIRNPEALKPGVRMPTLWRADDPNADEEVAAITAYLLSLGRDTGAATATLGDAHGDR